MNHYPLCPKRKAIYKKCQCGLIDRVTVENHSLVEILSPDYQQHKSRWYYSGRQDAAEEIEDLMHIKLCNCDTCKILVLAYNAALGGSNGRS
jgi:hypothetical protein